MTDPDLLIPIKQTGVTTRHSDLREPQPSSSDSQPASSQPVSETTASESSVSLPHLVAQAQRAPVQVAPIVLRLRHHPRAAQSRLRFAVQVGTEILNGNYTGIYTITTMDEEM